MTEKIHPQTKKLLEELRKMGVNSPEETLLENLTAKYLNGKIDLQTHIKLTDNLAAINLHELANL